MSDKRYEHISVERLAGACGAEITGVDLSKDLDEPVFAEIHQAFLDHLVIFFRNQNLRPEQQIAFARRFGPLRISDQYLPLEGYPEIIEIVKEPKATGIVGNLWHADESFLAKPALGSVLYMRECPPVGGDTMFANQYMAFETLSPGMQQLVSQLRVVFSDASLAKRNAGRSLKINPLAAGRESLEAVHPAVRTNPETGRKALFVHRPYAVRFDGMTEAESAPLMRYLFEHSAKPEFTCRFRWAEGSMALWDNRTVQHYALNDYPGERRYAHRVTIEGEVPV